MTKFADATTLDALAGLAASALLERAGLVGTLMLLISALAPLPQAAAQDDPEFDAALGSADDDTDEDADEDSEDSEDSEDRADALPEGALGRLGERREKAWSKILEMMPCSEGLLMIGDDGFAHLHDRKSGKQLAEFSLAGVKLKGRRKIAFAPGAGLLAAPVALDPTEEDPDYNTLRIWHARRGKLRDITLQGAVATSALALSADGAYLAAAAPQEASLRIFAVSTGKLERVVKLPLGTMGKYDALRRILFSPGAEKLYVNVEYQSDYKGFVFGRSAGSPAEIGRRGAEGVGFDRGGKVLVLKNFKDLEGWSTGAKPRRRWRKKPGGTIQAIAADPRGTSIAIKTCSATIGPTGCPDAPRFELWDPGRGKRKKKLKPNHKSLSGDDGMLLALGPRGLYVRPRWSATITRLDRRRGKALGQLPGASIPSAAIVALHYSPDSAQLATLGSSGQITVYNRSDGEPQARFEACGVLLGYPQADRIVSISATGRRCLHRARDGKAIEAEKDRAGILLAVSEDRRWLLRRTSGSDKAELVDNLDFKRRWTTPSPIPAGARATVSDDGTVIGLLGGGSAQFYRRDGKKLTALGTIDTRGDGKLRMVTLGALPGNSGFVAAGQAGKQLVLARSDHQASSSTLLRPTIKGAMPTLRSMTLASGAAPFAVMLQDGALMAVKLDPKDLKVYRRDEPCSTNPKTSNFLLFGRGQRFIYIDPGARHLAVQCHQSVQLWSMKGVRLQRKLEGHNGYITAVAFSPDGSELATASSDGSALRWKVSP